MENSTPMLAQYHQIKSRHADCILFFRLGDFYEMFYDDARTASGILDLVLTSRGTDKNAKVPMCGIPYHAADNYIARLIKAGLKVAICEQVEDPALTRKLVKRDVIRIVTAGTFIDENHYESSRLACLFLEKDRAAVALVDMASGAIRANEYSDFAGAAQALAKASWNECVFPAAQEETVRSLLKQHGLAEKNLSLSPFDDWSFSPDIARQSLLEHFATHNLRGFGLEDLALAQGAVAGLLEYLKRINKQPMRHLNRMALLDDGDHVFIPASAAAGLDLEELFKSIDHTLTAFGKRKLKSWLMRPLKDCSAIRRRQQAVTLLRDDRPSQLALKELMQNTPDLEKCLTRISSGYRYSRDLLALRNSLLKQPRIAEAVASLNKGNQLFTVKPVTELAALLEKAVNPEMPLSHSEGKTIRPGYDARLDELRGIQENARQWLKDLQEQEIKRSGIASLKIGFNQVFGYYIEISKANLARVPPDYIRRQTLANAERFVTPALKEFEEKILSAEEKVLKVEDELLDGIFSAVLDNAPAVQAFTDELAVLDSLLSLGIVAQRPGYIAPQIDESAALDIRDGKHPVLEQLLSDSFIPNDTVMDCKENRMIVLTGPNMSGKSTYIRQTALLVIMAQAGSYIPATSASIGIIDKIFTRIGAHDEISKGQSTFMVEMSETAGILNNLTPRSLVVLDEIGRGTSTFDGLSLAWAIAEHLQEQKVKTIFATHFHELTALAEEYPGVKNFNVAVKEWKDEVIFMHKIVPGGSDDSYGIYVAKLAGIPAEVIKRGRAILAKLELSGGLQKKICAQAHGSAEARPAASSCGGDGAEVRPAASNCCGGGAGILRELEKIDTDNLTPIKALEKLQEFKERLNKDE